MVGVIENPLTGKKASAYTLQGTRIDDGSKIYVVITREGERMVKRIIPPAENEGEVTLLSDNPKQGKIQVDRNSIIKVLRVVYIGKVV